MAALTLSAITNIINIEDNDYLRRSLEEKDLKIEVKLRTNEEGNVFYQFLNQFDLKLVEISLINLHINNLYINL